MQSTNSSIGGSHLRQSGRPYRAISSGRSGRSVGSFNLHEALLACGEHLTKSGGHAAAAGLTIDEKLIDRFRGEVEFRNVRFAYDDENWVLKDLSFRIPAGQSVAGPTRPVGVR